MSYVPNENSADETFGKVVPGAGFCFENVRRNHALANDSKINNTLPKAHKTGTTIVGCVFKDGVVLGADTRATSNLVVDKNCEKIHYIAPNIYCCGAGTAADTEMTTGQISSQLELLRLNTGVGSRVITALTMLKRYLYQYQGHVSAALVLGGVDCTGAHLYTVYPHGSTDKLPFVTMGSGSLAAMSVMETQYKDNMNEEEAISLVCNSIKAGVFNDLGSGSNIDYTIITEHGVRQVRGSEKPDGQHKIARDTVERNDVKKLRANIKLPKGFGAFPPGTTITVGEEYVETF
mmetsp:Transcript_15938/g.19772  ORF Transcript_15938/g.19772 Transcript_15938/m.19772 type:complete len:291 (-) Transcript_15938:108-980(-)|eukprot:CAMPEP_0204839868 /NCGR_PEP_ID=MMETSP1346-20131115/35782_1 /ASSEMBLY_ACC=CAM_ASM_000771 /TAXON_ID=215587 /ORGANISM="Aplanochytrium stocchinoi, Strain GSBS06" /LENGTH=290 /DNA_ID=CAMNT_0051976931 /DNA_START=87 /DNA_END=959 /DNA_ORIENTATION=-